MDDARGNYHVLLIGHSSIARRRILPALRSLGCERLDVASRSALTIDWHGGAPPRRFDDYADALRETNASIAYVSTVSSQHALWARRALEAGLHVAVDKPCCMTPEEADDLVTLARRNGRVLAEVVAYPYHPQFDLCREAFAEAASAPAHLLGVFSFPPLDPADFRYRSDLGGGAISDLGPYVVSPGRLFFDAEPLDIQCRKLRWTGEVETSFSVHMIYPGGRSFVGTFGYATGYINRLDVLGPDAVVTLERAFTTPPDATVEVTVRLRNEVRKLEARRADSFALLLADFFDAIERAEPDRFHTRLLADARVLARLRASAMAT